MGKSLVSCFFDSRCSIHENTFTITQNVLIPPAYGGGGAGPSIAPDTIRPPLDLLDPPPVDLDLYAGTLDIPSRVAYFDGIWLFNRRSK